MARTFGLFLVESGVITRKALQEALRSQRETGRLLGTCLLEEERVRRGALLQALSSFIGVPPAPPSRVMNPDPALARSFEADLLRRLSALPYAADESNVYVALADPGFRVEVEGLEPKGDPRRVVARIATEPDVEAGLAIVFGRLEPESARIRRHPEPPRVIASGRVLDLSDRAKKDDAGGADGAEPAPKGPSAAKRLEQPTEVSAREAPATSFDNEEEVTFARATGFDRERTAVFRLDDLAAAHKASKEEKSGRASAEEPLPPPRPPPDLAGAVESVHQAPDEGAIARAVVDFFGRYFSRVLLLTRHDEELRGALAKGLALSDEEVEGLRAPTSSFSRLFRERIGYYGPPPGGKELEPLYEALGTVGVNAFMLPVECWYEPSWLIYADHAEELRRYADVRDLEVMAKEVAISLGVRRGV